MRPWPMVALSFACATPARGVGDFCGTPRATMRYASELHAACALGDFYACETALAWCAERIPDGCEYGPTQLTPDAASLAVCIAREPDDGTFCTSPGFDAEIRKYPNAKSLYERQCARTDDADARGTGCLELGLLREHEGDLDAATKQVGNLQAEYSNEVDLGHPAPAAGDGDPGSIDLPNRREQLFRGDRRQTRGGFVEQ